MTRNSHLSEDIDLIREFEELKLKQQLLISSLQTKKKIDRDKILLEINSKLDFLVEIFQKTNEEETTEGPATEELLSVLSEKMDEIEKKLDDNFSQVSEKITKISISKNVIEEEKANLTLSTLDENKTTKNSFDLEAPKPLFSVANVEDQNGDVKVSEGNSSKGLEQKEEVKAPDVKKKRKWF